jgi:hypothetical protein
MTSRARELVRTVGNQIQRWRPSDPEFHSLRIEHNWGAPESKALYWLDKLNLNDNRVFNGAPNRRVWFIDESESERVGKSILRARREAPLVIDLRTSSSKKLIFLTQKSSATVGVTATPTKSSLAIAANPLWTQHSMGVDVVHAVEEFEKAGARTVLFHINSKQQEKFEGHAKRSFDVLYDGLIHFW